MDRIVDRKPYRVYCAGPLFNPKEREEMGEIASALESKGYRVFLPHRDGLEYAQLLPYLLRRGLSPVNAEKILNMAIFSLDVYHIGESQGLALNMNGRVPDEGAMVEAGIAWASNKKIVIFRSDSRSLIEGNCNPLVLGLSGFSLVTTYEDVAKAFDERFFSQAGDSLLVRDISPETVTQRGRRISSYLESKRSGEDITELLISLFWGSECPDSENPRGNCTQANTPL